MRGMGLLFCTAAAATAAAAAPVDGAAAVCEDTNEDVVGRTDAL